MPTLRLPSPQPILLVPTFLSFHARAGHEPALNHIRSYDSTRCFSIRDREEDTREINSQINFDLQSSKDGGSRDCVSNLVSSAAFGLSPSNRAGSGNHVSKKQELLEEEKPPMSQYWKASIEHERLSVKPVLSNQATSSDFNANPIPIQRYIPKETAYVSSGRNGKRTLKPQRLSKKYTELLQANSGNEDGAPLEDTGSISTADVNSTTRMRYEPPSGENQVFLGGDEDSHAKKKRVNETHISGINKIPLLGPKSFRKVLFTTRFRRGGRAIYSVNNFAQISALPHRYVPEDVKSQKPSNAHIPGKLAARPTLDPSKSVKKKTDPENQKLFKEFEKALRKNPEMRKDIGILLVKYQSLTQEIRNPSLRNLKQSEVEPSEIVTGEQPFQPKQAPTNRKLPQKSRGRITKTCNLSQIDQAERSLVANTTKSSVEISNVSEEKSGSQNQEMLGKYKSPLASSQMLSDLSGSSKVKTDETSKEVEGSFPMHAKRISHNGHKIRTRPELSLLEELFPEEIGRAAGPNTVDGDEEVVPRLPLPDFDHDDEPYDDAHDGRLSEEDRVARSASKDALHQWKLAVLVITRASKSLHESDFRRIAPRGQHIDKWHGPGDFIKVIPARNPATLRQAGHYFLLFPNPAYARAYQSQVVSLHRISRAHTPTSIESPMTPPPGMLIDGEDVYSVLQNYSLCPPSQKISLKVVFPPYSTGMKRLLELRGYPQIMGPQDKSHKSVLFWVNDFQLTVQDIKDMLYRDQRSRGLVWALVNSYKPIEKVDSAGSREWDEAEFGATEPAETTQFRGLYPRYLINFADEDEARRFTRAWHRRPFYLQQDNREPPPLVHAEVVW